MVTVPPKSLDVLHFFSPVPSHWGNPSNNFSCVIPFKSPLWCFIVLCCGAHQVSPDPGHTWPGSERLTFGTKGKVPALKHQPSPILFTERSTAASFVLPGLVGLKPLVLSTGGFSAATTVRAGKYRHIHTCGSTCFYTRSSPAKKCFHFLVWVAW